MIQREHLYQRDILKSGPDEKKLVFTLSISKSTSQELEL